MSKGKARSSHLCVGYVALAPFIGGAERSLQILIEQVRLLGVQPIIFSPKDSPLHGWAAEHDIKSYPLQLTQLKWSTIWQWFGMFLTLLIVCKRHDIALLHSNQLWSIKPINRMRQILGLKLITHFRDPVGEGAEWWLKPGIDGCISISNFTASEVNAHVAPAMVGKHVTIINPVKSAPYSIWPEALQAKATARAKLNVRENQFVYAFLGQISPVKGVETLIKAFSKLPDLTSKLLIAGKPPPGHIKYAQDCINLVEKLGLKERVLFLGFLADPGGLYSAADVVVMPSVLEPLGRVPLEASAFFKPTIATQVGGLPETIQNGLTGWLIRPECETALQDAMTAARDADLKKMGIACAKWRTKIASPEVYGRKILAFYQEVLEPVNA